MSWIDDFSKFLKMEEELDLFKAQVDGVMFWERIRFQVYATIINRSSVKASSKPSFRSGLSRLKRLFLSVVKFTKNPLLAPRSDILFVSSSRRFLEADGLWWDIYSDPIIENLSISSVTVETHFNNTHRSPAKTTGLRYLDFFEFISYFKRKLGLVKVAIRESEAKLLAEIRNEILRRFEFAMDVELLTRRILEERKAKLPFYVKMLRRIQPKVVVMTQGYVGEDIIEACKIQGVTSVELQHGVIHPQHIAYSFTGESRTKKMFTDYILLWGEHWKSNIEFPIDSEHIISVGFPYLDSKRKEISEVSKRKQILFISQGIIGKILSRFAVALNKEIGKDYSILYKLHPRECVGWREQYPDLAASDVLVIDKPGARLHSLFLECSIQVGVCSTALYEGLVFGLQSYVIDAPCVEIMAPLLERELVKKVSTPNELIGLLKENRRLELHDVRHFFRENAVENIGSFLEGLCKPG